MPPAHQPTNGTTKGFKKAKPGENQKILVGTVTEWYMSRAAFEYIFNIDHEPKKAGVRDNVDIKWISNESFLGDFGMGGLHMKVGGYL